MTQPTTSTVHAGDPQRIYHVLFPGRIPPELERRFVAAWQILAADYGETEHARFRQALDAIGDLEAVELVCRRRKRLPVLSAQVALMVMLAETLPSHVRFYRQERGGLIRGILSMALGMLRTAWKYSKGLFLVLRLHDE